MATTPVGKKSPTLSPKEFFREIYASVGTCNGILNVATTSKHNSPKPSKNVSEEANPYYGCKAIFSALVI